MPRTARSCVAVALSIVLLLAVGRGTGAQAFRFSVVPGRVKCFTSEHPEGGRYELRYRMMRSLTPFVSVAVTSRGGRVLMEHELAKPDAREIISVNADGLISICFHTSEKAAKAAVSTNVTLDIVDAEDAELTRMKKRSYSTTSPITLGAGKGSGSMQQMQYIYETFASLRLCFVSLTRADEDIRYSLMEAEHFLWIFVYVFVGLGVLITLGSFARLRIFMKSLNML
ncbi:hypothetical protein GH5_04839 [Leishmania sp. Ghana 2012 LV757]|uniref:hypothetical protein n=1 Tax=Leishmania sp. Ghana 2012 LV757 TaxID=2803181 RepID=UPI001B5C4305|nr:hypothetical protein GH5_04839 [Leishmania sp. Ghana 2012 LV757]